MAWKVERWLNDVFPGEDQIYAAYRHLGDRDLAIIAAGVLDLALAELLTLRLVDNAKEVVSFLGLGSSGVAPVGTFGARIQLGVLLGILTPEDAGILRDVKNIRNAFAHRIKIDFCHESIQVYVRSLFTKWSAMAKRLAISNGWHVGTENLQVLERHLAHIPEAGEGLLLAVFTAYQAYFHRLSERICRVTDLCRSRRTDNQE